MNCVVVIPIYTLNQSYNEWLAFDRAFETLPRVGCHITFVAPTDLDCTALYHRYSDFTIERFEPRYFDGISGYNALVLSEEFYARFLRYEHMLIYQGDCYIFDAKQLERWCKYDYVGAPWVGKPYYSNIHYRIFHKLNSSISLARGVRKNCSIYHQVGNGGLSLRRVAKFHAIAKQERATIEKYLAHPNTHLCNEDVFWCFEPKRLKHKFKKPSFRKALLFSMDMNPDHSLHITKGVLPFGCHGWNKSLHLPFWAKFIKGAQL